MSVMHPATTLPPIEAFHVGTHTDMRGRKLTFTRNDLKAMVDAYDPAVFAAPMVIGHPSTEAPAVGWLGKLKLDGDKVVAVDHDQVNADFAGLVKDGAFKKVSLSMFTPDAPDNPKPGIWYPRHLGWLGAAQPALTGLKAVNFSADQSGYVSFVDYDDMTVVGLFRGIKNFLLAKFSTDAAGIDNALPEYQLSSLLINAAEDDAAKPLYPNFSAAGDPALPSTSTKDDPMSADQLKAAQDAATAEKARADEATRKLAASEAAARSVQFAAEADGLIKEGRLHPDERDNYVAFMARPDDQQTVEFSAADGTTKSFNARQFMADFIKRRAPLVEMKEVGKGKVEGAVVSFAAPPGMTVDAASAQRHAEIDAYAKANKVPYVEAARALGF